MSSSTEDRLTVTLDRVLDIAVPVGLAVLTWLAVLVGVGFLARLNSLTVLNILPVVFVGLLFWPIYRAAPWRPGATAWIWRWARHQQTEFMVVLGLGLLPNVPFIPSPRLAAPTPLPGLGHLFRRIAVLPRTVR